MCLFHRNYACIRRFDSEKKHLQKKPRLHFVESYTLSSFCCLSFCVSLSVCTAFLLHCDTQPSVCHLSLYMHTVHCPSLVTVLYVCLCGERCTVEMRQCPEACVPIWCCLSPSTCTSLVFSNAVTTRFKGQL